MAERTDQNDLTQLVIDGLDYEGVGEVITRKHELSTQAYQGIRKGLE